MLRETRAGQIISQHSLMYSVIFLAFVILFRTPPGQYFMRGGQLEVDNPLVSCCRDAELPDGAARAGAGPVRVSRRERERERERAGQSQYYNLLQSLRAQPAARQQPHSTHSTKCFSESDQKPRLRGFCDGFLREIVSFRPGGALCVFI